jgi:uncharacterized protein YndB with AHSA1/START domain
MSFQLLAKTTVHINAPASKVWEALTTPAIIKLYFFGTDVITDWKVDSSLIFKGVWEGKPMRIKERSLQSNQINICDIII